MSKLGLLQSGVQQASLLPRISVSKSGDRNLRAEAASVYRGLLRAATYLPDSLARKYAFARIRSRFRADKERGTKGGSKTRRDMTIQRLTKARRSMKLLEDAGDGCMDSLKKVFLKVHGREGERKRWLIKYLLEPDEEALPKDASALQMFIEGEPTPVVKGTPAPKLLNFIKNQQANQPVDAHNSKIRQVHAKVPSENIWGRPTPIRMQKKHIHKWWVTTLEKLLPPIPRGEWERLRDIATGVLPLEAQPVRRTALKSPRKDLSEEQQGFELLQYFQNPARQAKSILANSESLYQHGKSKLTAVEARIARNAEHGPRQLANAASQTRKAEPHYENIEKSDYVLEKSRQKADQIATRLGPIKSFSKTKPPEFRARSLRRLYATIWSLTPTMAYNAVSKRWDIEWGGKRSRALEGAFSKPTLAEEELFEGLAALPKNLNISEFESRGRRDSDVREPRESSPERQGEAALRRNFRKQSSQDENASEQESNTKLRKLIGLQRSQTGIDSQQNEEGRLKITRRPV